MKQEEVIAELRRIEDEKPSDERKLSQSMVQDFLQLGSVLLAMLGLILNQQLFCIVALGLTLEMQVYAKGEFNNVLSFIPLGVYFLQLWRMSAQA